MDNTINWHHQMPAQLRFSDVDQFGHVNNSVYFSLFDMCKTKYVMDVVGQDILSTMAIVVVNIKADFLAPIYYPDEIVIQSAITHLGKKSFVISQRTINTRTNEVKCVCRTTMVAFDMNTKQSIELPDSFKHKVAEYEKIELE